MFMGSMISVPALGWPGTNCHTLQQRHPSMFRTRSPLNIALLALLTALTIAACGGGGGGGASGPSGPPAVSGSVAAGLIANADVKVYDATTYTGAATSTPVVTTTTNTSGAYTATLPAGFSKPVLIRVTGKADGTTTTQDEIYGPTPLTSAFVLEAVVPASAITGGTVTAHVTAYTNAMAAFVANKLGQPDIDAAIAYARAQVTATLTASSDPLTTTPTSPRMTTLLAAASNISKATPSIPATDPLGCATRTTAADKISCGVQTVAGALQPLAQSAPLSGSPTLNYNPVNALKASAQALDVTLVATNTGLASPDLASQKTSISTALAGTRDTTLSSSSDVPPFLKVPDLWIEWIQNGRLIILSGPDAGTYVGWLFQAQLCYVGSNCFSVGKPVGYTPQDLLDDPAVAADAQNAVTQTLTELNKVLSALRNAAIYPPESVIKSAISAGIDAGIAAQSVSTGVQTTVSTFAAAGYAVPGGTTPTTGANAVTTPAQIAAAQACTQDAAYQNPASNPYDPQLDSNCRLAQVNACIHRDTGITAYDAQGRAACSIVQGIIGSTSGSWTCGYCPYPY